MKAITEIHDDVATVEPLYENKRGLLAAQLLTAAGPGNGRLVRTVSVRGGGRAYLVPLAVADAAGLITTETTDPAPAQPAPHEDEDQTPAAPDTADSTDAGQTLEVRDTVEEATDLGDGSEAAESDAAASDLGDETKAADQPTAPAKKAAPKKAAPRKAAPKGASSDVE